MFTTVVAVSALSALGIGPLSEEYLEALWQHSPMAATQAGLHRSDVDRRLDDLSPRALERRVRYLQSFRTRLDRARADAPTLQEQADAELLDAATRLELLELTEARDYSRRCDLPLDNLGTVLFQVAVRPYATAERRRLDLVARLEKVPRYLEDARASITYDVEVFRLAARDDGAGLLDYLRKDLLAAFPDDGGLPSIRGGVDSAARGVERYLEWVNHELPTRPRASFRYGRELYEKRFGPYLQTDEKPAAVLDAARRRMSEIHEEMARLATVLGHPGDVRAALAVIAEDHPKADELLAVVRAQLNRARAFVQKTGFLSLVGQDNLRVIETPPFLRSMLGVAAFDGAPPLDPSASALYYVTPFPSDWSPAKVESKLREYNRSMLELLTIHEAMPGHYVQFEHANRVEPRSRRILRWVLGAGSYIEGWAVYTQDLMVEAGYLNRDPRLRLTALKLELRAVTNAILDIELHTNDLSDEAALELMTKEAFQERPEAEQKLMRAKLSVTQLCSYFVGGSAWREIRKAAEALAHGPKPAAFDARRFHDRALGLGAVTLPMLKKLLVE